MKVKFEIKTQTPIDEPETEVHQLDSNKDNVPAKEKQLVEKARKLSENPAGTKVWLKKWTEVDGKFTPLCLFVWEFTCGLCFKRKYPLGMQKLATVSHADDSLRQSAFRLMMDDLKGDWSKAIKAGR